MYVTDAGYRDGRLIFGLIQFLCALMLRPSDSQGTCATLIKVISNYEHNGPGGPVPEMGFCCLHPVVLRPCNVFFSRANLSLK